MIKQNNTRKPGIEFHKKNLWLAVVFGILLFLQKEAVADVYPYPYSLQNGLLGLNEDIWASANYGAGVTYGVIDTGVAAPWVGFQGRVSGGACMVSGCSNAMDDNGHGTFVASMIAGDVRSFGIVGIAPAATVLPVKVLDADGSGYVSDVARGISYAAKAGARVLNLSMSFVPTPDLVSAVNYAAAKKSIIVFAGGNSGQAFMNNASVGGFTDTAIQRMIFMGSTDASRQISSFSNTPGTGGLVSTSGQFYSFASRWMMADGEAIWGASTYHPNGAYTYITQMSGTSMAAPQGAGAAGLMAARWPFLLKSGTIPEILLSSAQDLGASGSDSTYGSGFLRIDNAFKPAGPLTVLVKKKQVPATDAILVPAGAIGNVPGISAAFARAVGYDSYKRDFPIYVSQSILSPKKTSKKSTAAAVAMGQTGAGLRSFTELGDGGWIASSFSEDQTIDPTRSAESAWSVAMQREDGSYVGAGEGVGAALAFNDARWGGKTAFFNSEESVAGSLLDLSPSSRFLAIGADVGNDSRIAVASMASKDEDIQSLTGENPEALGLAVSYTMQPAEKYALSIVPGFRQEGGMLLGSTSGGYLSFGKTATASLGFGGAVDLGRGYAFGVDTIVASTTGSDNPDSLISSTSRLASAGFSMVLKKAGFFERGDDFSFSVAKPLRVYSGSARLDVPVGTDEDGNPVMESRRVSLAPSGNETDVGFSYNFSMEGDAAASFDLFYRHDADNMAGERDVAAMFRFTKTF